MSGWLVFGVLGNSSSHVVSEPEQTQHELDRGCWCRPHVEARDPTTGRLYAGATVVVIHRDHAERAAG